MYTLDSGSIQGGTDYGHMKAKSLILCGSNSNPNPKQIFGWAYKDLCGLLIKNIELVCSRSKVWDFEGWLIGHS